MSRAVLWGASVLVLGRLAVFALTGAQGLEWDTHQLVLQNAALSLCLATGTLGACEGAGHFPLFQHLPAFPLVAWGYQPMDVLRVLAVASFASFAGLLVVGWKTLQPSREAGALWLVVLSSGPLLYYSQSSFGESLAAFLVAAAVASSWSRLSAPGIAALFALAGITKEFAPPVLMALGLIGIFWGHVPRTQIGRRLGAVAIGSLVAIVANASFNLLRFGVPYNQILLGPTIPLVPLSERPSFFLGLWFSPNGGLLFFWVSFVAVLVSVLVQDWRSVAAKAPASWWFACSRRSHSDCRAGGPHSVGSHGGQGY